MKTVKVTCSYCKNEFDKPEEQITQHTKHGYQNYYCNPSCQNKEKSENFINNFNKTGLIKCSTCQKKKNYVNFDKSARRSIGYGNRCKDCSKQIRIINSKGYKIYKNSLNNVIQSNNSGE